MKIKLAHLKEFDGVRAIAALMIMFFHFFQHLSVVEGTPLALVRKLSFFGQTGVTLFFVLSGFLITRILLNSKNSESYFKPFYMRRSLRIFPLYFLFLIIYYFIVPLLFHQPVSPFSKQWSFWVYLQNFAITFNWNYEGPFHFWSLAVEEHFYLFWPVVVYFLSVKNLTRFIYAIVIGAVILRAILFTKGYEVFYFTFTNIDSLALGGLLAIQEMNRTKAFSSKRFATIFFICLLPTLGMWFLVSGQAIGYVQWFKFLFISIIYYAILGYLLCDNKANLINKALRIKFLEFTGKISYGLYVYHPLCFSLLNDYFRFHYVVINFVLAFAGSYLMAICSYYLFEVHFLKLKKYFNY